ncbi:hypothetical protein MOX02_50860 [Methylobacterium oxalidis]|uniref:Uncharacterized protein n=1 Tax=Methylobacterium oxalidis TaxID=944322 RepID=A0A512JAR3_9HYPH|nr:hypothetical protein MOX02_50860 [Methylobacterium oxalidis]GLS67612.1 hypothetical protein GCM10007888_59960 [Methylobacterium oxalidis]
MRPAGIARIDRCQMVETIWRGCDPFDCGRVIESAPREKAAREADENEGGCDERNDLRPVPANPG